LSFVGVDQGQAVKGGAGGCVLLLATEFGDLFQDQKVVLHSERTFFGVHRVLRDVETGFHELHHGRTMHGMQSIEPSRRHEPLAYFHRASRPGVRRVQR